MKHLIKIALLAIISYNCSASPQSKETTKPNTDSIPMSINKDPIVKSDSLTLLFIGDIMGHDTQIKAAYSNKNKRYQYESVFAPVKHIIEKADISIANLEVTLAGKPYRGYPAFSSPDALLFACKSAGIDILMTSNNHSCDRGKKGITRTLKMLDSLSLKHTGTFKDNKARKESNLLITNKNNIKLGYLNYTYGTNGIKTPKPCIVNKIDTTQMAIDISDSKSQQLDKLIVMIHWGLEYQSHPSKQQIKIANFLFRHGVDIIIGSHPHVLQRMEFVTKNNKQQLVVYSLGNFVSNQRTRKRDGGAMVEIKLKKENGKCIITDKFFHLTWVNKPIVNNTRKFEIIPCKEYEKNNYKNISKAYIAKMKIFLNDSRKLLEKENINFPESK